jgi:hypothetical protein
MEGRIVISESKPLFTLGQTVATPGALDALIAAGQSPAEFLDQHVHGRWGDVCESDRQANDDAVRHGERILSAYRTNRGVKLWVITEADRSSTCILLPDEY